MWPVGAERKLAAPWWATAKGRAVLRELVECLPGDRHSVSLRFYALST